MAHATEDCRRIFAMLSQYLDMELPPDTCEEMETHLAGCPPCIEFAESLRQTVALCREYQATAGPDPINPAVRERLLEAWQRALTARKPPQIIDI